MEAHRISPQSAANFRMIDVSEKEPTRRRAVASGKILMSEESALKIRNRESPKGDPLAMAEVVGIMAAKNASMLLPLCHPLQVEVVRIQCDVFEQGVHVVCEVITTSKTGVEMEALCGLNAALLAIYDLTKAFDPVLKISDIRLELKEGGKSGVWHHPESQMASSFESMKKLELLRVAIITVSDRCSRRESSDESGLLLKTLNKREGATAILTEIVPDEIDAIRRVVLNAVERGAEIIWMTGGTGLGPRDVTPEAVSTLIEKELNGFGEYLRSSGRQFTKKTLLSRSMAGVIRNSLVVTLPGSPRAVQEGFDALCDIVPHAIQMIRGGNHELKGSR